MTILFLHVDLPVSGVRIKRCKDFRVTKCLDTLIRFWKGISIVDGNRVQLAIVNPKTQLTVRRRHGLHGCCPLQDS